MKLTLAVLAFFSAASLPAAYNYQVLSGASEGAMVSRTISGTDHTYVAYRDASGSLAVARPIHGLLSPVTVWANMPPSNTSINVSTSGMVLVTFWSGNKYRYAMSISSGNGNCGPASDWQCGDVPLPTGMTATSIGRIHGDVDSTSRAHFIYAFRNPGISTVGNGLYYRSRHFLTGVWSGSNRIFGPGGALLNTQLPTAVYVGTAASPANLHFTSYGGSGVYIGSSGNLPATPSWTVTNIPVTNSAYGSADTTRGPSAFCDVTSAVPAQVRVTRRSTTTGVWLGSTTVYNASQPSPATAHCSISERPSGGGTVALTSTLGIVSVANTSAVNWTGWALTTVDSSSTFSKTSVGHSSSGKILVLYHGAGYLKFASEQ